MSLEAKCVLIQFKLGQTQGLLCAVLKGMTAGQHCLEVSGSYLVQKTVDVKQQETKGQKNEKKNKKQQVCEAAFYCDVTYVFYTKKEPCTGFTMSTHTCMSAYPDVILLLIKTPQGFH